MYGRNGPHPGHSCYLGVNFRFVQLVPLPLRRESVNEATSETERNDSAVPPCRRARRSRHSRRPWAGRVRGDGTGSPPVANVSTTTDATHSATPATTVPKDNAAQSLIEWANCMRSHGDPGQPDPTIDSHGGINIFIPGSRRVALQRRPQRHRSLQPVPRRRLRRLAGRGDGPRAPPDQAALVKFSHCMRANGVPNYPDPGTGGTSNFNGTGVDPSSPFFQRANNLCGKHDPRAVVVGQRRGPAGQHLGPKRPDVRGLGVPSA